MFDVCVYGSPVLRKKALDVTEFDDDLRRFVAELTETMYERDGVGLAAPQVGRSVRIAVIDTTYGEKPAFPIINPRIEWFSPELGDYEEGCLSVPDIRLNVKRPLQVTIRAQDITGAEFTIEKADGLLARALQHEIDHLDGIMFVDRVSPLQRQLVASRLRKLARESREAACTG